jgi:hypothetical protein
LHSKPADPSHCKIPSEKSCQTSHPFTCPVSASDQLKFTHALSDPSHGIIQELEETLLVLTPAHTQALAFLIELQNKSARNTARLQHLSEKPAEEQVETLAILVTNLIESVHKVALKTCSSTFKSTTSDQQQEEELTETVRSLPPNHHYSPRPEKNKNMRNKKLNRIKQFQNLLSSPFINAQGTTDEILQQNSANPMLLKAIQGIKHIVPDQTLKKQLDDMYTRTRQAITNTAALHNKEGNNIARKKQEQLRNKAPKKAHKEISKDKNAQPRASLQAVIDPETGKFETEPTKKPRYLKSTLKTPGKLSTLNTAPTSLKKHLETTHGNTHRTSQEINLQTPLNYKQ